MPDPINYTGLMQQTPTPFQQALQGYQAGQAVQTGQFNQQIQQYQLNQLHNYQQDVSSVLQNPNAGPQDYAALTLKYPQQAQQIKDSWGLLNEGQQRASLDRAQQAYSAILSGRPDVASQTIRNYAQSLTNSGAPQREIDASNAMADAIDASPQNAQHIGGMLLASVMGPDKFAQTFGQIGAEQRAQNLEPYEQAQRGAAVADISSQIQNRAAQQGLAQDALLTNTQLKLKELKMQYGAAPESSLKDINSSAMDAATNEQTASRLDDLASRIQQAGGGMSTGVAGDIGQWGRKVWGDQNANDALRQEYARIANNSALQQMKSALGGRVTNADMKIALGKVPGETASPDLIASYLRGNAMLQRVAAAQSDAQSQWLSQNGRFGAGPASKDMTVSGVQVPQGTTFADFSDKFVQQRAKQVEASVGLANAKAQGRSYMNLVQPNGQSAPATTAAPAAPAAAPAVAPAAMDQSTVRALADPVNMSDYVSTGPFSGSKRNLQQDIQQNAQSLAALQGSMGDKTLPDTVRNHMQLSYSAELMRQRELAAMKQQLGQ
jgi:hypothetical protein